MMYQELRFSLEKPPVYTRSEAPFWDDEHISGQMLRAHLDPDCEGASRKLEFIERSVSWIRETVKPSEYRSLLDLGCGPGIYAEKFAEAGYQVTGIDCSKRSIRYAAGSAKKKGLEIRYLYQDYLKMDLAEEFDFATMIYCDYGALSSEERRVLLKKVYRHLRDGGSFLLDVFSMEEYRRFQEKNEWEICRDGGFWRGDEYIALKGRHKYSGHVTLEQTSVISRAGVCAYYVWNTCFAPEALIREVEEAGFQTVGVFGDVAGGEYRESGATLAVLLRKGTVS